MKKFFEENIVHDGDAWHGCHKQRVFRFDNNYGASVVWEGRAVYGDEEHPYELAVIKFRDEENYNLVYDTPVSNDVVRYQNEEQIRDLLGRIKNLEGV